MSVCRDTEVLPDTPLVQHSLACRGCTLGGLPYACLLVSRFFQIHVERACILKNFRDYFVKTVLNVFFAPSLGLTLRHVFLWIPCRRICYFLLKREPGLETDTVSVPRFASARCVFWRIFRGFRQGCSVFDCHSGACSRCHVYATLLKVACLCDRWWSSGDELRKRYLYRFWGWHDFLSRERPVGYSCPKYLL